MILGVSSNAAWAGMRRGVIPLNNKKQWAGAVGFDMGGLAALHGGWFQGLVVGSRDPPVCVSNYRIYYIVAV